MQIDCGSRYGTWKHLATKPSNRLANLANVNNEQSCGCHGIIEYILKNIYLIAEVKKMRM